MDLRVQPSNEINIMFIVLYIIYESIVINDSIMLKNTYCIETTSNESIEI